MKEITRVIEAKVTLIETMPVDDVETIIASKNEAENNVKSTLMKLYGASDVQVEIKDFVMDKEGLKNGKRIEEGS